ncbi:MAG: hypothetical protein ACLFWB_10895 [Armatimonadota bacterium]
MQVVIAIVLGIGGILLFWWLMQMWTQFTRPRKDSAEPQEPDRDIIPEEEISNDGLVYMFAGKFIQPVPNRPIGSLPRDRAFCPTSGDELDPRDFAQQLLYATLVELYTDRKMKFRLVERDASFMPPFPHKTWELNVQRLDSFGPGAIAESLECAFDIIYKKRLRGEDSDGDDAEWVALDELIEHALSAIRQELSFWERGSVYSDFRHYTVNTLLAQGYMLPPEQETLLDKIRRRRPTVNERAVNEKKLTEKCEELQERLESFRRRFGSSAANEDPRWPAGDVDPGLLNPAGPLEDLPLDDCLRISIYETLIAIRQLEPSGEAGV